MELSVAYSDRPAIVDGPVCIYRGLVLSLPEMKWQLLGERSRKHVGSVFAGRLLMLHRIIVDCPDGLCVDHIDGDALNNVEANLRICTNQQNLRNMRSKGGTSRFKGVSKAGNRFVARIMVDGKDVRRKSFLDELEAARQYDEWARELFGEFARTNVDLGLLTGAAS